MLLPETLSWFSKQDLLCSWWRDCSIPLVLRIDNFVVPQNSLRYFPKIWGCKSIGYFIPIYRFLIPPRIHRRYNVLRVGWAVEQLWQQLWQQYMHVCIYAQTHTPSSSLFLAHLHTCIKCANVYMQIDKHLRVHAFTYTHIRTRTHTHTHSYSRIHTHTHTRTSTHTHICKDTCAHTLSHTQSHANTCR